MPILDKLNGRSDYLKFLKFLKYTLKIGYDIFQTHPIIYTNNPELQTWMDQLSGQDLLLKKGW